MWHEKRNVFFLSLFSAPCHYPCLVTVFFYGEKAVIAVLNSLAKLASPFFHDACRYTYHKLANFLCDHRFSRVSQKVRLRLCFICLFLTIIASRNSFAKFTSYFCRVTFNHSFSPSQKGLFHIQPSCTRLCCICFIFLRSYWDKKKRSRITTDTPTNPLKKSKKLIG